MNFRQRILADRFLATPLAFVFNGLARILGAVLRRDHGVHPAGVRRIVVAKLVGMGSAIQATPLLRALKQHYPGASLTFVTLASNRELVARLPDVDEVLCLDDRGVGRMVATTIAAVARLIRLRADLYFDLELYSAFASLLALWAVTRNRIGFYRHTTRFKRGIYTHIVYFNTRMPVRRLYLQLGRVIGVPPTIDDGVGRIRVEEKDRASLRAKLTAIAGWRPDQPYLVLNPNASDLLLERRWPAPHVLAAVERLAAEGLRVVLIGSGAEAPYVHRLTTSLAEATRGSVADTAGRLTVGELLALLDGAACVVTNDTGPMHMAVALGRPTVCLFGPVSPDHHGHDRENVVTLYAPVFCSPCVHEVDAPPCNGDNVCMQRLGPDLVVGAVLDLLARPAASQTILPLVSDGPGGKPLGLIVRESIRGPG